MRYINKFDYYSIKELPVKERPREKILEEGSLALSDEELICCILGTGTKGKPVQELASDIVELLSLSEDIEKKDLAGIEGLGTAKAAIIQASLELGRRFTNKRKTRYDSPQSIFNLIRHYGDRKQEHLITILFNGALEVLSVNPITIGLVNQTVAHPREVFAQAIEQRATAIVIAHNHPSGNLRPSQDDIEMTDAIVKAGRIMKIKVIDHLIFSSDNYYSMAEDGLIV